MDLRLPRNLRWKRILEVLYEVYPDHMMKDQLVKRLGEDVSEKDLVRDISQLGEKELIDLQWYDQRENFWTKITDWGIRSLEEINNESKKPIC